MGELRSYRCKECGASFYATEPRDKCQHCEGDYDRQKQIEADAAAKKSTEKNPNSVPSQSVDPRTGQGTKKTASKAKTKAATQD